MNLDKFRDCLIGGTTGDAPDYAVEFLPENFIFPNLEKTELPHISCTTARHESLTPRR